MHDPERNELVPITLEEAGKTTQPVFFIGRKVIINGVVFEISSMKKKRLILKLIGRQKAK